MTGIGRTRRAALDLPASRRARGDVRVPGSKSISIRALLLAALADGTTRLDGVLASDDTTVMIDALGALGVPIDRDGTALDVRGTGAFPRRDADLFVGNSGLSIRTLTAALAFAGGRYRLAGVPRMQERPIADLVDALNGVGARIGYAERDGFPPLVVAAATPPVAAALRTLRVVGATSSQFVTGVLMAAPSLADDADVAIDVVGPLISRPYVDLTIGLMRRFGVDVTLDAPSIDVVTFKVAKGARYTSPGTFAVEGDASSASYLLAAGLLGGGPVRVEGVGRASLQGDARFVDVLIAMGATVAQDDAATTVASPGVASGFRLRRVDADFNHIPDAAMTVAVLALFADGPSTLRNIGSWRVKETDRIAAMAHELARFGAVVAAGDDWLRVEPVSRAALATLTESAARGDPVEVSTYDDHRIAMCLSLATFLGVPVRIDDPDCVAKTFPDYFERFGALTSDSLRPAVAA